jgi:hypothetical protein
VPAVDEPPQATTSSALADGVIEAEVHVPVGE